MSINQSRAERSEGHLRKAGRSGSSGQHRGFYGGGGAPPPPLSSNSSATQSSSPSLSSSRSFRKSGNGQGSQPRLNPSSSSSDASTAVPPVAANRAFQNGVHPQSTSRDVPPAGGTKPVDMPVPRNPSRVVPRAPPVQSAAGASDSSGLLPPAKGDSSREVALQFGTINPGIMNGMQIPARTSSAPPNLDEQKQDQVRHGSFWQVPSTPLSSDPKQQEQQQPVRKDIGGAKKPNSGQSQPPLPMKKDPHLPIPSAPVAHPKSNVLPMSAMPMSMPFQHQQPQVPLQFGGPNPQMQPQGVIPSSLQMTIALPVANAPQVPQQMYIPGVQAHSLQQQMLMHQGQGLGFAPPISHQLAPQLGKLGIGITPQFAQQQPGRFGVPRKSTVKITHPDTHEELKLDKRTDSYVDAVSSGQRPLPSVVPQSQPIQAYTQSHQISYYTSLQQNSYNPSAIYFPTANTVPLTSNQMPIGSQAPRYSYPVNETGQPITFSNPSVLNPMPSGKLGPLTQAHGVSEGINSENSSVPALSNPVKVTVRPPVSSRVEKVGTTAVTSNMSNSQMEALKLLGPSADAPRSHQESNVDIGEENSVQQPKQVLEPVGMSITDSQSTRIPPMLSTLQMQSETSSSDLVTPIADPGSVSAADGKKNTVFRRSDSLKDHRKKTSKRDTRNFQQQSQLDASDSAGIKSSPIVKDKTTSGASNLEVGKSSEKVQSSVVPGLTTSTISLPSSSTGDEISLEVGTSEAGVIPVSAASSSFGVMLEEPSENMPLCFSGASPLATDGVSIKEGGSSKGSTSSGPEVDGTMSGNLCSNDSENVLLMEVQGKEMLTATEHGKAEVSSESLQDLDASEEAANKVEDECEVGKSIRPALTLPSSTDADLLSTSCLPSSDVNEESSRPGTSTNESNHTEIESNQNAGPIYASSDLIKLAMRPVERDSLPDSAKSERTEKLENKVTELSSAGPISAGVTEPKENLVLETTKIKSSVGKKKKLKDILSKADAAGSSDLYNAYKGPEKKNESVSTLEGTDISSTTDAPRVDPEKDVPVSDEDGQGKADLDDWEDAADIVTPKLRTSQHDLQINGAKIQPLDGNEAVNSKKYSRDFLLTVGQQYTELPEGFEIGSDIADALMSVPVGRSYVVDHEPYPSPGRILDRSLGTSRSDRRLASNTDDNKWIKSPGPFSPGRDSRQDFGYGVAAVSFRPGQGVNHGVLRNPRNQPPSQFVGGILSGPIQSVASQGGMPRSSSDSDRWQRASGIQRGLMPSPQTPLQIMHKAERKYEVGKVSDEEQAKQRQLKGILNKLTPQNFDKLFAQVKEVNIDNAVTLTGVISQIFDKALTEPTFCEMYANFCFHLAGALPDIGEDNEKITFRRLLLNKCQEEFERGEREQAEADKVEEEGEVKQSEEEREEKRLRARRRMLGNIRLIGELYKKKMLTERIMHECIKKLLGQYPNPDEEDIEALCKLMSTIGEMIDHSKAKEHMDAYFDMMLNLSANQKLSSRVRFMLKDSIDLRKNKWQQRRKVEGPKKIEEVHRDAAQERQSQASRLARGPVITSVSRRGQPADYGVRGSSALTSSSQQVGTRGLPSQTRGYGKTQDVRLDDRHQFESRISSLPLPQRPINDDSITLGPQGGLARGMSTRGQPVLPIAASAEVPRSVGEHRRMPSGPNGYNTVPDWTSHNSREDINARNMADRFTGAPFDQQSSQDRNVSGSRESRNPDRAFATPTTIIQSAGRMHGSSTSTQDTRAETKTFSEEVLQEKSISAIREFYSAKDEKEVALCMKELNSPSFYPSVVSLWVIDSFERKDIERDLLAKLLIDLCKPRDSLLSQGQLIQGFESVLSTLEDAVNDAPKAAEYLGHLFSKLILENVVSLSEIGRLIREGGEEPGRLQEIGLASEVLGSTLESIRLEKGDSVLSQIRASSNLLLEDFRPPRPIKSKKLDAFL
ncbi:eukaryotic translation initiation factor 4G-like [Typha latifolia]|uniref:eukaryotic translation initiation factor 4G-like n=1 Tax=Typha latifolia TaxID=4733 RepID=UPI003C2C5EFC